MCFQYLIWSHIDVLLMLLMRPACSSLNYDSRQGCGKLLAGIVAAAVGTVPQGPFHGA